MSAPLSPSPDQAPGRATGGSGRTLGAPTAVALVVGGVIGVGIFLTPVEMARGLGSFGLLLVTWAVTGLMAASGALCYGELAARFPEAGGPYVYLRETYGAPLAFLYGWKCLLVMDPGLSAAIATGAAGYAAHLVPMPAPGEKVFALTVILGFAVLTALGTRLAAGALVAITVLKVGALVAIVAWGFGSGAADAGRLLPLFERAPGAAPLVTGLAGGFVAAFFSFGGWWEASKMAGEVRDPERTLPFVFLVGVAIVTALYVFASAVFVALLPAAGPAGEVTPAVLGTLLFGAVGGKLLAAVVVVSALGGLAAFLLAAPRLYVAMASDGLFPRRLGRRHPRLGTPVGAISVQAGLACVLVAVGTFGEIVAYFIFATVAFITLSVASTFVLPPPPTGLYRAPARKLAAGVFVALAVALLVLLLAGRPVSSALGAAVVALGLPVYFYLRRRSRGAAAGPTAAGP